MQGLWPQRACMLAEDTENISLGVQGLMEGLTPEGWCAQRGLQHTGLSLQM